MRGTSLVTGAACPTSLVYLASKASTNGAEMPFAIMPCLTTSGESSWKRSGRPIASPLVHQLIAEQRVGANRGQIPFVDQRLLECRVHVADDITGTDLGAPGVEGV